MGELGGEKNKEKQERSWGEGGSTTSNVKLLAKLTPSNSHLLSGTRRHRIPSAMLPSPTLSLPTLLPSTYPIPHNPLSYSPFPPLPLPPCLFLSFPLYLSSNALGGGGGGQGVAGPGEEDLHQRPQPLCLGLAVENLSQPP